MNKFLYFFLGIILYYPAWVFKSNLFFIETLFVLFIFYLIPIIFHNFIFYNNFNKYNFKFCLYLSIIFTYSLDQNYGIMTYMDMVPNFFNISNYALYIYISGLIVLIFFQMHCDK